MDHGAAGQRATDAGSLLRIILGNSLASLETYLMRLHPPGPGVACLKCHHVNAANSHIDSVLVAKVKHMGFLALILLSYSAALDHVRI